MDRYNDHSGRLLTNITLGVQEHDLNGVIAYGNPALHELLGYAPGEIIGKTIFEMVQTTEQRQALRERLERLISERPAPKPYIASACRKDGSAFPAKIDWNYLHDEAGNLTGFISIISDYSEEQALQQRLQVERDLARHYIDTAKFMMLIMDDKGIITLVNHELCRVLGYKAEELVGKNWFFTCVPKEQSEMFYGLFMEMIAGRAKFMAFYEADVTDSAGNVHLVSWANSEQRDADGKVIGYICSGEDITERRKIEKEKMRLQDEVRRFQKMESVNRLTAGIAHDFNNILASVLGYGDIALDTVTRRGDKELQRYLTEVVTEGEKARDLIKQLLGFSRSINASNIIPPAPLIKETIKALQESAGSAVTLSVMADDGLPNVEMAPEQLHQLLLNTITGGSESLTTTQAKHISVAITATTLDHKLCSACNSKVSGEFIEITVSDDGQGIAPETLNELFNPLPSTKYTTATRGLLLAQGALHNHYGHIAIESIPGFGTTAHLYIPVAGSGALGEKPVNTQTSAGRTHIMIVDDEASIAHLKGEVLSFSGCAAEVFSDSLSALNKFEQQPEKYSCVLIKYDMPSLNGAELAQALLALWPGVAIILFTAAGETPELPPSDMSTVSIVDKTIPAEALTSMINQIIGERG